MKNIESKKYIEKYGFEKDPLFERISLTDGGNRDEVLSLMESGLPLIAQDAVKASTYFLAVSLLDGVSQELSSLATDIMLYVEEKGYHDIPKDFTSVDDIKREIIEYKKGGVR